MSKMNANVFFYNANIAMLLCKKKNIIAIIINNILYNVNFVKHFLTKIFC